MTLSRRAVIAGAPALIALAPAGSAAAPSSKLIDPRWAQSGARGDPDYQGWAAFLAAYRRLGADGIARVDYRAAKRAGEAALRRTIAGLEQAQPTKMRPPAAFAYWANLYNLWTIALVLEAYPVDSIKKVRGGWFNLGPWDEKIAEVEGRRLSLDDIEHGILRPVFGDARVHYAVNCAAIGCPNLSAAPFTAADLEARLDAAARAYIRHPRGALVETGRLTVSSIYDWFQDDFGGDDAGVIAHLRRYADAPLARALADLTRIDDDRYDWALNDVAAG